MKKSYLTLNDKLKDSSNYADASGMRFFIDSQKDADMLYGKIRRLTGRDEIRKKAIKIIVKKKLNIPDNLLSTWEDPASTEHSDFSNNDRYVTIGEEDLAKI